MFRCDGESSLPEIATYSSLTQSQALSETAAEQPGNCFLLPCLQCNCPEHILYCFFLHSSAHSVAERRINQSILIKITSSSSKQASSPRALLHPQIRCGYYLQQHMADTSFGERVWIVQGVEQDLRTDGRGRLGYRPLGVEANIIAQADGSARLHLGATDVIVGVKVCLLNSGSRRQQQQQ